MGDSQNVIEVDLAEREVRRSFDERLDRAAVDQHLQIFTKTNAEPIYLIRHDCEHNRKVAKHRSDLIQRFELLRYFRRDLRLKQLNRCLNFEQTHFETGEVSV